MPLLPPSPTPLPLTADATSPHLPLPDLERFYDELAEAVDRAGPDKSPLFLAKLALLLGAEVGDLALLRRAMAASLEDL